jgi:hypothetical protein
MAMSTSLWKREIEDRGKEIGSAEENIDIRVEIYLIRSPIGASFGAVVQV